MIYDLTQAIQPKTKNNHLVTDYKPNNFSKRHDLIGVLTGLPMLHIGLTGQVVYCEVEPGVYGLSRDCHASHYNAGLGV